MNSRENQEKPSNFRLTTIPEPMTPLANLNFSAELKKVIHERNILTTRTKKRVFEDLDKINNKNVEDNKKRRKENALFEILSTEKNYIHQLEVIKKFFMKAVQERDLVKPDEFEILFGNINTIYSVNQELLQELYKGTSNVVNAFSKIAPFLKLYSVYASEFKKRLQVLQNLQLYNAKFTKFLELQESRPEVQSKLSALLIAPIQRVPRYTLLLKKLVKLGSPLDSDYNSLTESLSKVQEAADHINKVVEEQENIQRLLEFQRYLRKGEVNIIKPGRKLIKEGILSRISSKSTHSEKLYVVLMNDIIIFCKMKKNDLKVNSLKCFSIFPLNKCKVIEILDKGCLQIVCQNEKIVLYDEQLVETRQWIKTIKEAIADHLTDRKTLRKECSSRRPVKRKDLKEYNEIGLSPGKRLKKRRTLYIEETQSVPVIENEIKAITLNDPRLNYLSDQTDIAKSLFITLNAKSRNGGEKKKFENKVSPLFTTLKPKETDNPEDEKENEKKNSSINANPTDVFIFGQPNNNARGFTFNLSKLLGGIGSSLKRMFSFK